MESDTITSQVPQAAQKAVGEVSSPWLNYARPRRFARLRRWLRPGSPAFFVLVLALAAGGAWKVWKLRLAADERAFNGRAVIYAGNPVIEFHKPPNAASLRHLARLRGTWTLYFTWPGDPDPSAPLALRGHRLANVGVIECFERMDVDPWLKELCRSEAGLTALTVLELSNSKVTDAGLNELSRPDSSLKTLAWLNLFNTQVTDAGLKVLARPDCGLKSLASLQLQRTSVTDAGLKELARPDCGLKALTQLYLDDTKVTDTGVEELKKARPGLKVFR